MNGSTAPCLTWLVGDGGGLPVTAGSDRAAALPSAHRCLSTALNLPARTDASLDPLTRNDPIVEEMGVRAWAGYPVRAADGHVLGSSCVLDNVPRTSTPGRSSAPRGAQPSCRWTTSS